MGTVIQSVFGHFNFLVVDIFYRTLLVDILAQKAVEVLIATTPPTRKGSSKVVCDIQPRVRQGMPAEFFVAVVTERLDHGLEGCECIDDRLAYQVSSLI